MKPFFSVALVSMLASLACAQPQNVPPRSTRAITLIGDNLYLYGGSSSGGECFSDLFSLNLNPSEGWVVADAKWNRISTSTETPALGVDSWAVASSDAAGLLVYGQSLCPQNLDKSSNNPPHTYTSTSGSALFHNTDETWSLVRTASNIFGNRSVVNDQPVSVQVVDTQGHVAYTFVYDFFNPQLGMQLWSFPTSNLPTNIVEVAKNTTMPTSLPPPSLPPPTNGTNTTVPVAAPVATNLAPWIDVGSAVFLPGGTIVVVGGGKDVGDRLSGDNIDAASGYNKMDRCWVYTIATNEWAVRPLTGDAGAFPLPRRLHALAVVGTSIYMHGGNTTETIPTDSYASDMWILNTQTWAWTRGTSSNTGRAMHTLVHFAASNNLLAVSGFQFLTTTSRSAQNSFLGVYDIAAATWGVQFGTINLSYFQQHAGAIIGGSVAGFLVLIVIAAALARVFRKRRGPRKSAGTMIGGAGGVGRNRSIKPFLASMSNRNKDKNNNANNTMAGGAASQLSGMTLNNDNHQRSYDTEIDLSSLPRASESTMYQSYNPYGPTKQQQQVPLMSANALEQQRDAFDRPYADEQDFDDIEEKDAPMPINIRMPADGEIGSPVPEHSYPGQTAGIPGQTVGISGNPVRSERAVREDSVDYL
ncbi:hypothetical protein EC991_008474 [Linnemannia zychae]|nr:hypothetical protein EC991_008474 [Linnemannia zychae]